MDRDWIANDPLAAGASYQRHVERRLTDSEIRQRVAGAVVQTGETHNELVKLVLTKPGQPNVDISVAGNSFALGTSNGKIYLALALGYEMGLDPETLLLVQGRLAFSPLMGDMADHAGAGFQISLEPLAEWALQARAHGVVAGEPPNPFELTDQQLRDGNAEKTFHGRPRHPLTKAGGVYVLVADAPARLLRMPRDHDGGDMSTGFGWSYGGQGPSALTVGILQELGLGRLEALALSGRVDIGRRLPPGAWQLPASQVVEVVIDVRHAPEPNSPPSTDGGREVG